MRSGLGYYGRQILKGICVTGLAALGYLGIRKQGSGGERQGVGSQIQEFGDHSPFLYANSHFEVTIQSHSEALSKDFLDVTTEHFSYPIEDLDLANKENPREIQTKMVFADQQIQTPYFIPNFYNLEQKAFSFLAKCATGALLTPKHPLRGCLLAGMIIPASADLTEGLVAYYPFNGNANDESGTGNDGAVNGATLTTDRFGNLNKAYSFDGADDYIQSIDTVGIPFGNSPFTLSAWVNRHGMGTAGGERDMFVGYGTTPSNFFYLGCEHSNGYLSFGVGVDYPYSITPLFNNIWFNIVATYNGQKLEIYKDGHYIASYTYGNLQVTLNENKFRIGRQTWSTNELFNGKIDDIRIYNRTLGSSEVAELYAFESNSSIFDVGLVAHYPFNGNANDESENRNNGAVTGATLTTDRFGVANSAYVFNSASDSIIIPSLTWQPTMFMVSFWINPKTCVDYNNGLRACNRWSAFYFHVANGGSVYLGTDASTRFTPAEIPVGTIVVNNWQHVVYTFNGNYGKFYKNGVLFAGKTQSLPVAWTGFCAENIDGSVDDIHIYNRALSDTEIAELYDLESHQSPRVNTLIATQIARVNTPFGFTFPNTTFINYSNSTLTYSAELTNGTLLTNTWLNFNATARSFQGTPISYNDDLSIRLIADDGLSFPAALEFDIAVNAPVTESLVAHYPFNGNANDESGHGNYGTVYGATLTTDRFGVANMAYSFDGVNDYIKVFDDSSLDLSLEITLGAWIKFENLSQSSVIVSKTEGAAYSLTYNRVVSDNLSFSVHIGGDYRRVSIHKTNFTQGQWYFIIGTYDGTVIKIYLGDQLINELNYSGTVATSNVPLIVGAEPNSSGGIDGGTYFNGAIDDVRVYGRALDEAEIAELYNFESHQSPKVNAPITTQIAHPSEQFDYVFSNTTFIGFNNQTLSYSARLTNGTLLENTWLSFNATMRAFAGTPLSANDDIRVRLTADDGLSFPTSQEFDLIVNARPTITNPIQDRIAVSNVPFNMTIPYDTFSDLDGDELTLEIKQADGSDLPWGIEIKPSVMSTPSLVSSVVTSNAIMLKIIDGYAYVADGGSAKIIDISNLTHPTIIGSTIKWTYKLEINGDYLYGIDNGGESNIKVYDIHDRTNPTEVATINKIPLDVRVVDNYAYLADQGNGLLIIDISNFSNFTVVGSINTAGNAIGIDVVDHYAYVGDDASGFLIVDVSDVTHPSLIGSLDTPGSVECFAIRDNYAYVGDSANGMLIVDISVPSQMSITGSIDTLGDADGVYVVGNYAFVADEGPGLLVIDVSDPSHPTFVTSYNTPGNAQDVQVVGNYAFVADKTGGLQIIQVFSDDLSLSFTPNKQNFIERAGSIELAVTASDGVDSVTETFLISIENAAPIVATPIANQTAHYGNYFSMGIPLSTFNDPDGDEILPVEVKKSDGFNLPSWIIFERILTTVTLSGTPQALDIGELSLKAIATDGIDFGEALFVIDVQNEAPIVANPLQTQETQEAKNGAAFIFVVPVNTFSDADGNPLTLSALQSDDSELPLWLSFNPTTNTFSGTPGPGDLGQLEIRVTATDGADSVYDDFILDITNVAPILANSISPQTTGCNYPFVFVVPSNTFTDADGGPLVLSATLADDSELPLWLSFNPSTNTFYGTPESGDLTAINIKLTATDGVDSADTTFTITPNNATPIVQKTIPNRIIKQNQPFSMNVFYDGFTDIDTNVLSLTITKEDDTSVPTWLTVTPKSIFPRLSQTLSCNGAAKIFITNDYALVASGSAGIKIFSLANSANLQLSGTISTVTTAKDVFAIETTAYIADGEEGLKIVDFSNPNDIQELGFLATNDATAIIIENNHAIIADGIFGIKIIDVTNKTNPQLKLSQQTTNALSVRIKDQALYLADGISGIRIFGITTDYTEITQIGFLNFAEITYDVAIQEQYLFATTAIGLKILDISNPNTPTILSELEIDSPCYSIKIIGNNAYIAAGSKGLKIINITDKENPEVIGSLTSDDTRNVQIREDLAYITDNFTGVIKVIEGVGQGLILSGTPDETVSGTLTLKVTATDQIATESESFSIKTVVNNKPEITTYFQHKSIEIDEPYELIINPTAFIDQDEDRLSVLAKQTDGTNIPSFLSFITQYEELSTATVAAGVSKIKVSEDKAMALVLSGTTLQAINIADTNNPSAAGSIDLTTSGIDLAIETTTAFVLNTEGLQIVDINTPSSLNIIASLAIVNPTTSLAYQGNYIYLTEETEGLKIIDVTEILTPSIVASVAMPLAREMIIEETTAYILDTTEGLKIIDISTPLSPTIVGTLATTYLPIAKNIAIANDYCYVSTNSNELVVVDISQLTNPTVITTYETTGEITKITAIGDYIYLADAEEGLIVLETYAMRKAKAAQPQRIAMTSLTELTDLTGFEIPKKGTEFYLGTASSFKIMTVEKYRLLGTPTTADAGNYEIEIAIVDPVGEEATSSFNLRVEGPPVALNEIPQQRGKVGRYFSFFIPKNTFSDPNGDALEYEESMTDGRDWPRWINFNPFSVTFSGTPQSTAVGNWPIKITATDKITGSASTVFTLAIDYNPELKITLPTLAANITSPFNYTIPITTFEDKDVEDELSYSATRVDGTVLPDWLQFHNTTRRFEGIPQEEDERELQIRVTVDDGKEGTESTTFRILTEHFPIIIEEIEPQLAAVGNLFSLTFGNKFNSPEGDYLRYVATKTDGTALPRWMELDSVNGKITGTPASLDVIDDLEIKITAIDTKGGSVSETFALTVDHFPEVLMPITAKLLNVGDVFSYVVPEDTFIDLDSGDILTYTATLDGGDALPLWLSFDPDTKTFSGTPDNTADIVVKLTATDSKLASRSTTFAITTEQFPTLSETISDQLVPVGNTFSLSFGNKFTSPDSLALRFTATKTDDSALPRWMELDSVNGKITGTPASLDVIDDLEIKITAIDTKGGSVTETFALTVDHFPEVLMPITAKLLNVGDVFSYVVPEDTFIDLDSGDILTYTATLDGGDALPLWLSFDPDTKTFSGTPDNTADIVVKLTATDSKLASRSTTFAITTEQFPVRQGEISAQVVAIGSPFSLNLGNKFISPEGDALIFQASKQDGTALPGWLNFETNSCTFTGTPQASDLAENLALKIKARDSKGASIEETINFTIRHFPKVMSLIPNQVSIVNQDYSYQIPLTTIEDLSGRTLTYTATGIDDSALPSWLYFDADTLQLSGNPPINRAGNMVIKLTATNGEDTISTTFSLNVLTNELPLLLNPLADLRASTEQLLSFTIPANTFADPQGDSLNYTMSLVNQASFNQTWPFNVLFPDELINGWPFWLAKNEATRQLSGTPPNWVARAYAEKPYNIRVQVTDGLNQAHTFFNINLAGPSLTETVINTLATLFSIGLTSYKLWNWRYALLNRVFKERFIKPTKQLLLEGNQHIQYQLRVNEEDIGDIRVIVTKIGKQITFGGSMRPSWLHYNHQTNVLEIKSNDLGPNDIGTITIQVVDKSNVIRDQFDVDIVSKNPKFHVRRQGFFATPERGIFMHINEYFGKVTQRLLQGQTRQTNRQQATVDAELGTIHEMQNMRQDPTG